jgi:hypothetical protein
VGGYVLDSSAVFREVLAIQKKGTRAMTATKPSRR